MRLAAYVRVSTQEQADKGHGLDVQRSAIRKWARANGHRIVSWHADEGISGAKPADERPGLADALRVVRAREATGLVVARLDRLARSVTVQEAVLAEVWHRLDARMFEVTGEVLRDDPDDPMRTAMREMAGVFAGLERRMIAKRLRDGRVMKAAKGGHATGRYPYGWGPAGPVPDQQKALRRMRTLRAEGRSTRDIAEVMRAEGHPTARGGAWSAPVVARILKRETDRA
jgi:DNA invertase Pin-like site-specific DNA recombinase